MEFLIALGSNTGNRSFYLHTAATAINTDIGNVVSCSFIYESEPIGAADKAFLNAALVCQSNQDPVSVLRILLDIEARLGRIRSTRWGNRTIDLDIIMIRNNEQSIVIKTEYLTVPHVECLNRDFVLQPASDVAKDWLHPESGCSIGEHMLGVRMNSIAKKRGLLKPPPS